MELVRYDVEGPLATITVDHPPANALSNQVLAEIEAALSQAEDDDNVRVVIFTGAGDRFFIAGADIKEFLSTPDDKVGDRTQLGQAVTLRMERMPKIVIMAINGFCLGGGCEMAMAADIRLAADTAQFGQPEVKLGIIPGFGGTQRFPRLVGRSRAMELLFSGDSIDAQTALEIGLLTRVVPAAELMPAARTLAEKLATAAPLAVAAIKRAVLAGAHLPIADALEAERKEFIAVRRTADAVEGITAFIEKRAPEFKGAAADSASAKT
ncbi:MAG: enoyl-CoA hydratase-related protein [Candidatus Dormiibacterota bacterium]